MSDTGSHYWHLVHNMWVAGCNVCATIGYEAYPRCRRKWLDEFGPAKPPAPVHLSPPPPPINAIAAGSGRPDRGIRA